MTTFNVGFVTETCCTCDITFAFTREFYDRVRNDGSVWYCPRGHGQHYTGTTDAEKLRQSEARETALRDQLEASARELERTKGALLRDRHRFANGVCPCCNRSFANVLRHMQGQHPEYDVTKVQQTAQPTFPCSCGRKFQSLGGLHRHQTVNRHADWFKPGKTWGAHLTEVDSR